MKPFIYCKIGLNGVLIGTWWLCLQCENSAVNCGCPLIRSGTEQFVCNPKVARSRPGRLQGNGSVVPYRSACCCGSNLRSYYTAAITETQINISYPNRTEVLPQFSSRSVLVALCGIQLGRAIAQAVIRRLPTATASFRPHVMWNL
jgi:hypothetical protein